MASKLDLEVKNLLNLIGNGATDEAKESAAREAIKSFACSALNQVDTMRKMNVEDKVIKAMVEDIGIDYNIKQHKFL